MAADKLKAHTFKGFFLNTIFYTQCEEHLEQKKSFSTRSVCIFSETNVENKS